MIFRLAQLSLAPHFPPIVPGVKPKIPLTTPIALLGHYILLDILVFIALSQLTCSELFKIHDRHMLDQYLKKKKKEAYVHKNTQSCSWPPKPNKTSYKWMEVKRWEFFSSLRNVSCRNLGLLKQSYVILLILRYLKISYCTITPSTGTQWASDVFLCEKTRSGKMFLLYNLSSLETSCSFPCVVEK